MIHITCKPSSNYLASKEYDLVSYLGFTANNMTDAANIKNELSKQHISSSIYDDSQDDIREDELTDLARWATAYEHFGVVPAHHVVKLIRTYNKLRAEKINSGHLGQ